ncbi:MAG: hypothetical protein WC497_03115 [Patescibacteria group bacterium]
MTAATQSRRKIGEVVAHQMMRNGLRVFVVTGAEGSLHVGGEIALGKAPLITVNGLERDGQPIESVGGGAKVSFHLSDNRIIPNGTPVFA